jgi:cytochrome P450
MASTLTIDTPDPVPVARRPGGHWLTGHLRPFQRDRLGFLTECARVHGDMVDIRLGPMRVRVLNHPDLIEEVLVTKSRHFIKHGPLRQARPSLGNGLLTSEGDFWRQQRRLSQPAFHRDRVAAYAAIMVAAAERMLDGWAGADGQVRDLQDDMMRLTLEIVAKCLVDADVSGDAADASAAMETLIRSFTDRVDRWIRLPASWPTPSNLRFRRALGRLDRIVYRIIAERRASGADRGDLLSMLLHAQDQDDGRQMTDRQLRDEAMTLFMAGHETTANTLAWTWMLLSQNPDAMSALHEELDAVLGPGRHAPTFADLPRLVHADRVITEALRVCPTVWLLGREAVEPCTIGGVPVPVGLTLWMSQWVLHRDPRFFDDPDAFRPERWADGLARRLPRYAYFPFGGGPRICIGNAFAQMEAVLVLATMARRYFIRLAPGAVVRPFPTMTLRPDGGVKVVVTPRS